MEPTTFFILFDATCFDEIRNVIECPKLFKKNIRFTGNRKGDDWATCTTAKSINQGINVSYGPFGIGEAAEHELYILLHFFYVDLAVNCVSLHCNVACS